MSTTLSRVDLWLDGYFAGLADGASSRDAEVADAQAIADHWHFIANNPDAAATARRKLLSLADVIEARREADAKRAAMDAEEREALDRARLMIQEGRGDRDIAVDLGLYLPVVARIRAGAL